MLLDSQALFEKKKQMREAGFLFYFLFPQKQMRKAGFLFYFLFPQKQKRHVFYDDIWTDTRAMLDNKSSDFLEKRPFTRHYKVRKMRRL